MADVVLVPGAYHGAWCWRKVVPLLEAAGHRTHPLTLTGLGEHASGLGPGVGLSTHVDDVVAALDATAAGAVVLVAHSYGGAPAVGAADRRADRIAALVLLDALLPVDGCSFDDLRERSTPGWVMDRSDPVAIPVPSSAVFGIPEADRAEVEALLTPHPAATLREASALTGAYDRIRVRHHHRALGYPAPYFDDSSDRAAAAGWVVAHHDLPHDMMWTHPDWTAGAILAAT